MLDTNTLWYTINVPFQCVFLHFLHFGLVSPLYTYTMLSIVSQFSSFQIFPIFSITLVFYSFQFSQCFSVSSYCTVTFFITMPPVQNFVHVRDKYRCECIKQKRIMELCKTKQFSLLIAYIVE